ncbi:MAG: Phosphoacetylglucosamine Mutase [Trizodia sp. TS-e1964]|nr:MAG: Phosphoacetylglucosamine Mutase [Trizodia sp. TS-e1964]
MTSLREKIAEASSKYPKPKELTFQYGTSGFRTKAVNLDSVVFRVGLLAALRSMRLGGQTIGVMITASHNPPEDNGIKLVDPMGDMLEVSWEAHATRFANAPSDSDLSEAYENLLQTLKIKPDSVSRVAIGRDTRDSGPYLLGALTHALDVLKSEYTDYGILTTPQLHYLVRCINTKGTRYEYGEASEKGYYEKLATAFKTAMRGRKSRGKVTVDCANGVGGPKLKELLAYIPKAAQGGVDIEVVNANVESPEMLNSQCGADFVKTQQRSPPSLHPSPLSRCASLDGDADRIVYFFNDSDGQFKLLDGDKIATLAASFIGDVAKLAGVASKLKIGVVQTAYANGASTNYITKSLGLQVVCTNTGVKHLHQAAKSFDVGVYFEANGHGTVIFSDSALNELATHDPQSPAQKAALETLVALTQLINQTVGDALSDLLLVEVILAYKSWGPHEWESTYTDLPNRLVRIEVPDRNRFKAVDAERKLESPPGAQKEIDALVGKYTDGRSFARASGTEDAVRVFAEAATRGEADDLAAKVAAVVMHYGQ